MFKDPQYEIDKTCTSFLKALMRSGFKGDIEDSYGARIVASTDNSVYQVIPKAILYPRVGDDINCIVKLLAEQSPAKLSIVARGGGSGTNGQSLNESLILDTSRYLNDIIAFDKKAMLVTVEPGVVLDQLNNYLAQYGLFFPPDVSSSSRATLGGMVATDASGKGSRVYGKTSDYIHALDVVVSDGSDFHVQELDWLPSYLPSRLPSNKACNDSLAERAQQKVYDVITKNKKEIKKVFPKMNRGLTGYNLEHVIKPDGTFRLAYLLAGSEGTLALTKKIMLRVLPLPKEKALVAVLYGDYNQTLEHIKHLLKAEPTAIEVLDDKILRMDRQDAIWQDVQSAFDKYELDKDIKGLNFIEVTADSKNDLKQKCQQLEFIINETDHDYGVITHLVETNPKTIAGLWALRKRAVGLLGALEGERRPLPFVEDAAVPPENLPAFIREFRDVLDAYHLDYGMYGHADVGCLHVRPALDMRQQSDQKLLRAITDKVAQLTIKYEGLLWGEHGRGYRGEYSSLFFGEQLYPLLREIKAVFDPNNLFNPGKLAVPVNSHLMNAATNLAKVTAIDEVSFRGSFDGQIPQADTEAFESALRCNGNGVCFSWDVTDAMCPSYKATKDKRFSPKGRAAMLREWLRLSSVESTESLTNITPTLTHLEQELYESLNACLSCKSCTHSCPIKVDIPELKSLFLQRYFERSDCTNHKRKSRDLLFARFEQLTVVGRSAPRLINGLLHNPLSKSVLQNVFGLVELPRLSPSLKKSLQQRNAEFIDLDSLPNATERTLILIPDTFTASYESKLVLAAYELLTKLDYRVLIAPVVDNGKALHVKGFRVQFKQVAKQHVSMLERLGKSGLPLISLEVVTRLMHQKEYAEILKKQPSYHVWSIESWLINELKEQQETKKRVNRVKKLSNNGRNNVFKPYKQHYKPIFKLLPHCMEQTLEKQSYVDWQLLFETFNSELKTEIAGCCGMSGLFGHEKENQSLAEKIYQQSWNQQTKGSTRLLATGFSCRCQLRNHGQLVKHPIEALNQLLE